MEREFHARLDERFGLSEEALVDPADLRSLPDLPGGKARVTILPSDSAGYWQTMTPSREGFEVINARMLALPLYIFARNAPRSRPREPNSVARVAIASPKDYRLPSMDRIRELLEPVLNSDRVELKNLEGPEYLAEDLVAPTPSFDAVALFGEEPSWTFERFLKRYEGLAGSKSEPELLTEEQGKRDAHVMRQTRAQLKYVLLEYPRDSVYAFPAAGVSGAPSGRVTVGLSRGALGGVVEEPGIPFLLTDAGAKLKSGSLRLCCWQALRRALADAALASLRGLDAWAGAGAPAGPQEKARLEALKQVLLVDAFLGSRAEDGKARSRDETARGRALLAYFELAGYESTARRVQDSTNLRPSDDGRRVLAELGLQPQVDARLLLSCDTIQRFSSAQQALNEKRNLSVVDLRRIRDGLVAAIAASPTPASHKPGCGMTQVANYNPYLPLAQVLSMQQGSPAAHAQHATGSPLQVAGVVLVPVDAAGGPGE